MKKAINLILTTAILFTLSGCYSMYQLDPTSRTEQEIVHNRYQGETSTLRYVEDLDYTYIDYEEAFYSADRLAVGPTEPWYVGVLTLSDDEAQRLLDEYEWEECEFPELEIYDVQMSDPSDSTWYTSDEFNQTIEDKGGVTVNNIVFNGSELVFYLKTF